MSQVSQMKRKGGNTSPPSCASKKVKRDRHRRWCFTLNNYTEIEYNNIINYLSQKSQKYIVGKEGDDKTSHLQGYCEFKNQVEFSVLRVELGGKVHLEKAKGDQKANYKYCSKESQFETNIGLDRNERKLKQLAKYNNVIWKDWQQKVIDIVERGDNDRTINWVVDEDGNSGKSFLCKYLALKYDAIIGEGKENDILNQVLRMIEEEDKDPTLVLVDMPRAQRHTSYKVLEKLKNGMIYSGKYEGGQAFFDSPTIIVFANSEPQYEMMSSDRWNVLTTSADQVAAGAAKNT